MTNTPDPAALKEAIERVETRTWPNGTRTAAFDADMGLILTAARALAPLQARVEELEAKLKVGERFLNKCMSAWSCGEPEHRVKDMLDAADTFRAALATPSRPIGQEQREGGE